MTSPELPGLETGVSEELAGIARFFRRSLRFWRVPLVCLLLGAVAYAVFDHFNQPKYRSETVILYIEKGSAEQDTESSDAQRSVTARLKELLLARPNLERVIADFNLYPELRKSFGMGDAIEELKKQIDFRAPGGDTFSIAFLGTSPTQVQTVTAELARLVIAGDADLRKDQAKVALDFLVNERQARDAELRGVEEKLAGFMAQHPRFALDTTPLANGAAIRASLGGASSSPPTGRLVWPPRSTGNLGSSAPSAVTAGVPIGKAGDGEEARAHAELAAARETLTDKLAHYTPAHPDVRAAEAAVQRASARVAALAAAPPPHVAGAELTTPMPTAPSTPAASVALPNRGMPAVARAAPPAANAASESSQNLVTLETDWLKLTRAVTEARQRLDQIEEQLFRADIEVNSETGGHGVQVNVIDPAFLPQRPVPPGRVTLALIFAAAALALGALGALLFAAFDERIFAAHDLAPITDVLVEVPKNTGRRMHVAS
jgi:capsular polysaccharide biosynthesis protein